jgi:hypothetical protein
MSYPKMTKFRSMSLDEQKKNIEKLAQEALISREEMIAVEATIPQVVAKETEIPRVSMVQDKGVPVI